MVVAKICVIIAFSYHASIWVESILHNVYIWYEKEYKKYAVCLEYW